MDRVRKIVTRKKKQADTKRRKNISRAMSQHLMRPFPPKTYLGFSGGRPTANKAVNAVRWTRYLDTNERRVLMSNNGKYFVINLDSVNNGSPRRIYKPTVAYLNNPYTGDIINIRSNTPLPTNLMSVDNKGNRVYDPVKDIRKFSHPIVYDPKKRFGGDTTAPIKTKIFKMLKNYTNMTRTGANGEATQKKPYSIGNFNKTNKRYIPVRPGNKKKYKNISTTNRLPPLTMGNRRHARRYAYQYTNNGAEEPFTAVLNAWNKRNRINKVKKALAPSDLPRELIDKIATESTKKYSNYKAPRDNGKNPLDDFKGARSNRWMKNK